MIVAKKRAFILAALAILALTMIVSAAELRAGGIPVLAFRGTTADCSAVCMGNYATDRVNVTLRNLQTFFDAFGIVEGDPMYRPEDERVVIW